MTDPTTLPTYGAVRAAYVRDCEQQQRRHTRGIPTEAQRGKWATEFDRWAGAIRAEAWDAAVAAMRYPDGTPVALLANNNPYRND